MNNDQLTTAEQAMNAMIKVYDTRNQVVINAISAMAQRLELGTYGEVIEAQDQITVRFDDKYFNFSTHNKNGVITFLDNTITLKTHPNIKGNGVPTSFNDWLGSTFECSNEVVASYTANKFRKYMMSNF